MAWAIYLEREAYWTICVGSWTNNSKLVRTSLIKYKYVHRIMAKAIQDRVEQEATLRRAISDGYEGESVRSYLWRRRIVPKLIREF